MRAGSSFSRVISSLMLHAVVNQDSNPVHLLGKLPLCAKLSLEALEPIGEREKLFLPDIKQN
jgi:hypothetical protein